LITLYKNIKEHITLGPEDILSLAATNALSWGPCTTMHACNKLGRAFATDI